MDLLHDIDNINRRLYEHYEWAGKWHEEFFLLFTCLPHDLLWEKKKCENSPTLFHYREYQIQEIHLKILPLGIFVSGIMMIIKGLLLFSFPFPFDVCEESQISLDVKTHTFHMQQNTKQECWMSWCLLSIVCWILYLLWVGLWLFYNLCWYPLYVGVSWYLLYGCISPFSPIKSPAKY